MLPLSLWQKRNDAFLLRLEVMQARLHWLGRCVLFEDPVDRQEKIGLIADVTDEGMLALEFQRMPGTDGECEIVVIPVGFESELFILVEEVDNGTTEETVNGSTCVTHYS